jgi:hypothetical protein
LCIVSKGQIGPVDARTNTKSPRFT